ncbi:MAG TPA: two-component regulator propeller domain-containing protein [bacterium]|nr:two-component regulator propeller domain-containing protein [bacterium]
MIGLLTALIAVGVSGSWQAYTNTNFINDMAGSDSVLYLATNGGVVALDIRGEPRLLRTFVNTDGLPTNRCLCITRDTAGDLWVGTDGGGLVVIQPGRGQVHLYRPDDIALHIRTLTWDGTRLLCGSDQGVYLVETRGTPLDFDDDSIVRFTTMRIPGLLSDQILCVASLDQYWIGTNRGVVAVDRNFQNWTSYRAPFGDSVRAVAVWHDSLLLATEKGLAIKESTQFRPVFVFGADSTVVHQLVVSGSGIYLATQGGLYEADEADSTRFSVILHEDARALHFAKALWVGCGGNELYGAGLRYAFSGQSWDSYYSHCIWSASISDCAMGSVGDIYLCHQGGPITAIDSTGGVSYVWSPLPVAIQVRVDSKGRIWVAHFSGNGGLAELDPSTGTWQKVQWGASSSWNIIDAFGLDRFDTKWVFNGGATVIAIDSTLQQTVFQVPGLSPPPGGLYEFAFDSRGRVWLGLNEGLVMIDYGGTLHDQFDDKDTVLVGGLPSAEVRSVAVDGEDHVWVATAQGAAMWNGSSFQVVTNPSGSSGANNIYRVRVDASDRVWLLSDVGLSIYDQVARTWTNFTPQNSGLIANTEGIVGFYSSLALSDSLGLGLIGTRRGLSIYNYSVKPESTAEHVRVYPNPCILGVNSGVVIDGLPYDATNVGVRTLAGRLVADLQVEQSRHAAVWRPHNLASGLYLLVVTTPRGARVDRVALVSP